MLRIGREPRNLGTSCLKKYIKYCIFLLNFLLASTAASGSGREKEPRPCGREPCHRFQRCKIEEPHPMTTLKRLLGPGRKINQSYLRFARYLCDLWHKACIANRTSFHSFSWCMDLTTLALRA